jgi:hypothetical protein
MVYTDLDGKEVTEDYFMRAKTMTTLFHEHCQRWARLDDFPEGVFYAELEANVDYPQDDKDHYYWGFRLSVDDHEHNLGYSVLYLYVAVSDELGGFDLVGFWEEGKLVYLISRVDTSWSDVWTAEYPSGEIQTRPDGPGQPWQRNGRFTNTPTKED